MTRKEAIVKCCVLVALTIVTALLCFIFPNAATNPQTGMILKLPDDMSGHTVHVIKPSDKELNSLPEDTGIIKCAYQPLGATKISDVVFATLILAGDDPRSLHRPEVCLRSQGWRIVDKIPRKITIGDQVLEVMDYSMARTDQDENKNPVKRKSHYVYWWIGSDSSTPHDYERIIKTRLDNLFRNVNNRWGYPSVMVDVDLTLEGDEGFKRGHKEAWERAKNWIQLNAPVFQKSLGATEEE